jgi:hypothetical protein
MDDNTINNTNQNQPLENNINANQNHLEKKNIFQIITNLPSWLYGPLAIAWLFLFVSVMVEISFSSILIWVLPIYGIIKGSVEIASKKVLSGIIGITLSLFTIALFALFLIIGQMAAH